MGHPALWWFEAIRRGELFEFFKEVELGCGDGQGVDGGDVRGGFGLADGGLGFGGEEGAVALGVGVALGYCGGDAGGPGARGSGDGSGRGRSGGVSLAAGAMGGETRGDLLFEGLGILKGEERGVWAEDVVVRIIGSWF